MKTILQKLRFILTMLTLVGISIINLNASAEVGQPGSTFVPPPTYAPFLKNCILVLSAHPFEQGAIIKRLGKRNRCGRYSALRFIREINFPPCFRGQLYSYRGHKLLFSVTGENFPLTFVNVQSACQHLPSLKAVIFVGIGGGVNPNLLPGDICVPSQWACHTIGYVYNPVPKTTERGEVPSEDDPKPETFSGSQYHERHPPALKSHYYSYYPDFLMSGINKKSSTVPCSEELLDIAERTKKAIELAGFDEFVLNGAQQPVNTHIGGAGVSGTVFVDNFEYRDFLYKTYDAQVVDMESMAAAFVCQLYGKNFVAIRAISDLAGKNDVDGVSFIDKSGRKLAARNAAWFLKCFLNHLPR